MEWVKSIAFALVVWFVLKTFLFQAFRIPSPSMERTLLVGDWLFVNKAIYGAHVPFTRWTTPAFREPTRNDIVVFKSVEPEFQGLDVVKRVIGVAGDTLEMRDRTIYRNGVALAEPYTQYEDGAPGDEPEKREKIRNWQLPHLVGRDTAGYWPDRAHWGPIRVPAGHVFAMGDNRDESWDGRFWGFLPRDSIQGTPMFIYYSYDASSYRALPFLTAIRWGRLFHVPR
jgi:signal peptidase I